MKRRFTLIFWVVVPVLLAGWPCWGGEDEIVKSLLDCRATVQAVGTPTAQMPDLTLDKAYELQQRLAKSLGEKGAQIVGFKPTFRAWLYGCCGPFVAVG
jgi:hypothetical protein